MKFQMAGPENVGRMCPLVCSHQATGKTSIVALIEHTG
jgi:hypothetical protein